MYGIHSMKGNAGSADFPIFIIAEIVSGIYDVISYYLDIFCFITETKQLPAWGSRLVAIIQIFCSRNALGAAPVYCVNCREKCRQLW